MSSPKTLSDGQYTYELVKEAEQVTESISNPAIYERKPVDPDYQYTPDLAFIKGQTKTPIMQKLVR